MGCHPSRGDKNVSMATAWKNWTREVEGEESRIKEHVVLTLSEKSCIPARMWILTFCLGWITHPVPRGECSTKVFKISSRWKQVLLMHTGCVRYENQGQQEIEGLAQPLRRDRGMRLIPSEPSSRGSADFPQSRTPASCCGGGELAYDLSLHLQKVADAAPPLSRLQHDGG